MILFNFWTGRRLECLGLESSWTFKKYLPNMRISNMRNVFVIITYHLYFSASQIIEEARIAGSYPVLPELKGFLEEAEATKEGEMRGHRKMVPLGKKRVQTKVKRKIVSAPKKPKGKLSAKRPVFLKAAKRPATAVVSRQSSKNTPQDVPEDSPTMKSSFSPVVAICLLCLIPIIAFAVYKNKKWRFTNVSLIYFRM